MENPVINTFSLDAYLNKAIGKLVSNVYKAVITNPKESVFVFKMQKVFRQAEIIRNTYLEKENLHIPPFLISSMATECNLACKGCYAHANNICNTKEKNKTKELSADQWLKIFNEAAQMGISFILLAGGEPLLRKDVLEAASKIKEVAFPVFTNGTVVSEAYLDFFSKHLNLIPILSLEGGKEGTDERRGKGVYDKVIQSLEGLKSRKLFYGASLTVTSDNLDMLTSFSYISQLRDFGCKIIFFIEYVPVETHTAHLALDGDGIVKIENSLENLRLKFDDIVFLSFPGDEKAMGGCLAAGRGFLHISPDGKAEACPFSPYSDRNIAEIGLKEALKSPFFAKLRDTGLVGSEHTGGCTLFQQEEKVKSLLKAE